MRTLAGKHSHLEEIKKSRFIAVAVRVESPQEAMEKLDWLRDSEATHNCWAYKIGDSYRFSDDGEPGGTAGRPILAAIEGQGLDHVLVNVIRFYGGIKLGAGGLVRAYGGTAAECLRTAEHEEVHPKADIKVEAPFEVIGAVYSLFDEFGVLKLEETYLETGVLWMLQINEASFEEFAKALADATRGQATCRSRNDH